MGTYKLERFRKYRVQANSFGIAQIWWIKAGMQDVMGPAISPNDDFVLGPYFDDAAMRIETTQGVVTVTRVEATSPIPIPMNDVAELSGHGQPDNGQNARITINPSGNDNAALFVAAKPGVYGNRISVEYSAAVGATAEFSIVTNGFDIVVNLAKSGGNITTTATDIADAFNNHPLVSVAIDGDADSGNDGSGVVTAMPRVYLAEGLNGTGQYVAGRGSRYTDLDSGLPYVNIGTAEIPN